MRLKRKEKLEHTSLLWRILRFVLLLGLAYILLYPLIYMVSIAIRPIEQVNDPTVVWIPYSVTLENLKGVYKMMNFGKAFSNTFFIFIVSALIEVASCAFVGYGFARFEFPLKNLWFTCVILTILVPTQCIMIPLVVQYRYFDFFLVGQLGKLLGGQAFTANLLNTPIALYIPSIMASGIRSGLFIFIYRQFFLGLAPELEDAAYIDGCGPLKTFLKVVLPISSGSVIIVFLLSMVAHWNDKMYSSFFFEDLTTISNELSMLGYNAERTAVGKMEGALVSIKQSGVLLFMIFPLVIFLIIQRKFAESIQNSGIVG